MTAPVILCYHALSEDWPAPAAVTPEAFRRQLELLLERGYSGTTFLAAVHGDCPPRSVAVTFDDAFASVQEIALPILSELGLPATVFVPTDFPAGAKPLAWDGFDRWLETPHAGELRPMGWEALRGLAAAGWEIGSHTCSHPRLTQVDEEQLSRELVRSREVCEQELAGTCESLAYPYGDWDGRVAEAARAAGYSAAATLSGRIQAGPLHTARIGVYRKDDLRRFARKLSPWLQRLRRSRAWPLIEAIRS